MKRHDLKILILSFLLASCGHPRAKEHIKTRPAAPMRKAPPNGVASVELREVAEQEKSEGVIEISYSKGQKDLSETEVNRIKSMLKEASTKGKVTEVKVISWSDKKYPSENEKLSSDDIALAEERNQAIKLLIGEFDPGIQVREINMAERTNSLEKIFNKKKFIIKQELEKAGISNKLSKSVVMAQINNKGAWR